MFHVFFLFNNTIIYKKIKHFDNLLEVLQELAKKNFEIKISTLSFSEKVEKQKELFEDFFKSIDYRAIYSCLYKDQRIFNICVLSLTINEVLYDSCKTAGSLAMLM